MGTINVQNLGKAYKQYPTRWSRLREWLTPGSRKRHELKWVLQDINFTVQPGEAVGIIGINGAGKSTLLKLITGTTQPTTGNVTMTGRVAAMLELGMGFHPDFTGRQNVLMAGQLLGFSASEIAAHMPEIEAFAEVGDYIEQPVRVYSSGMQVRLAFAVATTIRPDILIIDEALSVGDAYFQHKCFSRILSFQEKGTTLLFVSHDLAAIRAICSRVVWVDSGSVREVGDAKNVLDAYTTEIYAKEQGVDNFPENVLISDISEIKVVNPKRDCRLDFINNSNIRNDIEVFEFKRNELGWGDGKAKIINTLLQDCHGIPVSWIVGGEEVNLTIESLAYENLNGVIVGFMVRDRLGQNLFGDNNYITCIDNPVKIEATNKVRVRFNFLMPILPQGTYVITVAIVSGTQKEHVVHEWIDDALFFESHNEFNLNGLIGVPMRSISIDEICSFP